MPTKAITTLNKEAEDFLVKQGAIRVGFATLETLADGPPSTNLTYVLPEARSAISYALPFDRQKIRDYLTKKSFIDHERNRFELNYKSARVSQELAEWLQEKGFPSKGILPNNEYRKEIRSWRLTMPPDISHRLIAARSGVASFGWSGNIGLKEHGTAIHLGTVVTSAELAPTDPIPPEETFCTKCKTCVRACTAGLFDKEKETTVTIGGVTFSYSMRHTLLRCQYVCGGFTGLNTRGPKHFSTWSPGRFPVPEEDKKFGMALGTAAERYKDWPKRTDGEGGYENKAAPGLNIRLTCGFCQLVCAGNPQETHKNYELITNSGCILQKPNGDIIVLPPEEAEKVFATFPHKHQKLYANLRKKN